MMTYFLFLLTSNDDSIDNMNRYIPSIYVKKNVCLSVCLSVRYAFRSCNSYRHQTFHDTSLGPEEGRDGVGITKKGQEGVPG